MEWFPVDLQSFNLIWNLSVFVFVYVLELPPIYWRVDQFKLGISGRLFIYKNWKLENGRTTGQNLVRALLKNEMDLRKKHGRQMEFNPKFWIYDEFIRNSEKWILKMKENLIIRQGRRWWLMIPIKVGSENKLTLTFGLPMNSRLSFINPIHPPGLCGLKICSITGI